MAAKEPPAAGQVAGSLGSGWYKESVQFHAGKGKKRWAKNASGSALSARMNITAQKYGKGINSKIREG